MPSSSLQVTLVLFTWIFINIIFLFNFDLAAGYLVIVNFLFFIASIIATSEYELP
jgi:hypothetical protein